LPPDGAGYLAKALTVAGVVAVPPPVWLEALELDLHAAAPSVSVVTKQAMAILRRLAVSVLRCSIA
jgi:hypothetical protein